MAKPDCFSYAKYEMAVQQVTELTTRNEELQKICNKQNQQLKNMWRLCNCLNCANHMTDDDACGRCRAQTPPTEWRPK